MDALAMARRVVALKRQRKAYDAMARAGDLTAAESAALIAQCDREIEAIRSQHSLLADAGKKPK